MDLDQRRAEPDGRSHGATDRRVANCSMKRAAIVHQMERRVLNPLTNHLVVPLAY
jgi:hypothetical protein